MGDFISDEELYFLSNKANEIRKSIIDTVYYCKTGHLGGPLSAVDILTALYYKVMNVDPEKPNKDDRDRFILSKGHASIALYATLALKGYFNKEELKTFGQINSRLQTHPDMSLLPGIDFSTGSLGNGISGAVGMALSARLQGKNNRVYCMIGDGELQEGIVWEAANFAYKYNLKNLTVILDYNKLQQYGYRGINSSSRGVPMFSIEQKWKSFGWNVLRINGHDFEEIILACYNARLLDNPTIIIADTIKGKGISFMEYNYLWHSRQMTDEEYKIAMEELNSEK